jgi:hypothetical protein
MTINGKFGKEKSHYETDNDIENSYMSCKTENVRKENGLT